MLFKILLMAISFVPTCQISIGNVSPFSKVHQLHVDSSLSNLTDTAEITLPSKLLIKDSDLSLNQVVRKGDPVIIDAGYEGSVFREFTGFVRQVHYSIPTVIECEDYAYLLKLDSHTKSWKNPTLKDIIDYIVDAPNIKAKRTEFDFNVDVVSTEPLGKFSINDKNGAKVLETLKEWGFYSYFYYDPSGTDKPTLRVGFPYSFIPNLDKPIIHKQKNIPANGWKLKYVNEEDIKIKIKAISNLSSGKKEVVEVGDKDGDIRTRNYFNISKDQLRRFANEELSLIKFSGYRGDVQAFGLPYIKHGDAVIFFDRDFPNQRGDYFIDRTRFELSHEPYIRRTLYPSKLLSNG